jgi:precorrin-2/cobalt-factor-2 C20-methyltransferase
MKPKNGILYGIGVGPGDPELITMKAAKILTKVDVVFAAASTKNHHSLAVNIARQHIPESTRVMMLRFPMTKDQTITKKAWQAHSETIINELEKGNNVAFLTLGDAMTYSTFGYIMKYVQAHAPHLKIKVVPGITSYQAAAACLNTPLVEGEESLMVVSGAEGGDRLRRLAGKPENVVFLKAYRNVKDISDAIDETGMYNNSVGVKNCSHPDQEVIKDIKELAEQSPNYWTLIIAKQKKNDDTSKG